MKTPIFSSGGCGSGPSDRPGAPASSTEMPASVLEPLQARSNASETNPFEQYDAPDTSAQNTEKGGACTAFASASDRDSDGRQMGNSSVFYPEGLPRFLGLLRPTMTFGIGHSTLSRGMDFIAHFVAITTLVCFFGIIIMVSWMQKLCLPVVRYWNHNYTLGFGAFMAVLAIFSWRSATNFDLKRSRVFLFLLGWRLQSFLLISLLMVLSLALKPQLHAHIENSVRACILERSSSEQHPLRLSEPSVSVLPSPSVPGVKSSGRPLFIEMPADEKRGVEAAAAATANAPVEQPGATAGETGAAEARVTPAEGRERAGTPAEAPRVPRLPEALPMQKNIASELGVQAPHEGATDSSKKFPASDSVDSAGKSTNPDGRSQVVKAGTAAAAPPTESRGPTTTDSTLSSPKETFDASAARSTPPEAASLPEAPPQADSRAVQLEPGTQIEEAKTPQPQDNQDAPRLPEPAHDLEGQKLAVKAAQQAAVQESNAVVVTVLVLASLALVFELYLVYACWSFKVWMERGYESVVLAGIPPFSAVDAGSGWLAYAVRMPQTVQMETYGNDARGSGRLPVFVQTTDSSDGFAHLGLPMTGRW